MIKNVQVFDAAGQEVLGCTATEWDHAASVRAANSIIEQEEQREEMEQRKQQREQKKQQEQQRQEEILRASLNRLNRLMPPHPQKQQEQTQREDRLNAALEKGQADLDKGNALAKKQPQKRGVEVKCHNDRDTWKGLFEKECLKDGLFFFHLSLDPTNNLYLKAARRITDPLSDQQSQSQSS